MAVQPTDLATVGLELAKSVTALVPQVRSLRMVFWLACHFVKPEDLGNVLRKPFSESIPNIAVALPPTVAGLAMTKRGRGYHVGHTLQSAHEVPTPYLSHKTSYITEYYYGSIDSIKHNWGGTELVDVQRSLPYQVHALSELDEDVAHDHRELVKRSSRILE